MKNRLKHKRNEELRKLYFELIDSKREGGSLRRKDALEKVLEFASNKYLLTSAITIEHIIFEYGIYSQKKTNKSAAGGNRNRGGVREPTHGASFDFDPVSQGLKSRHEGGSHE